MASALDTLLATQQGPNILGAFNQGMQNRQAQQANAFNLQQSQAQAPQRNRLLDFQVQQQAQQVAAGGEEAKIKLIVKTAAFIGDITDQAEFEARIDQAPFLDAEAKANAKKFGPDGVRNVAAQLSGRAGIKSAGQREFESLTAGLSKEDKDKATLVKLGLSPRAVGSAIQTISAEDIADQIGDAEAAISERKKFGEKTGISRANAIDAGFEKIGKIDLGIGNIDRAIKAIEGGANTGAIDKMFPSIKAASVELNQIQNSMALDVIGSVTLGALSSEELKLAKEVALPTGLDGPELINHLNLRKQAQEKLRAYFKEQIDFLDQGGTVAGFLRKKENEQEVNDQQSPSDQPAVDLTSMSLEELIARKAQMLQAQQ